MTLRTHEPTFKIYFQVLLIIALAAVLPVKATTAETELLQPPAEVIALQSSFSKLARVVKPAVVNISTVVEEKAPGYEFFFGSPFEQFFNNHSQQQNRKGSPMHKIEADGSGVIISPEGYILTNEHVVHDAKSIQVTLSDDSKLPGKVIGKDERTDVAVIQVKIPKEHIYARLGDSEKINVGEWVIAVGSPFGLEQTVTAGVISAKRQSLIIEGKHYNNLIQTDAAINRGNSGGPLFNIYGEVIGINTAIYAPTGVFSGVGFAIAINNAKEILNSLIRSGKVVRGWLGIEIRPVDKAIAKQFGLRDASGALVNNVFDSSPAKQAGLKRGDVITAVNGKKVNTPDDLQATVGNILPGKQMVLQISRGGSDLEIRVTAAETPTEEKMAELQSAPPAGKPGPGVEWEGMKVTTLTPELAQRFDIAPEEKGCVVTNINDGSVAEDIGMMEGDLIRAVNKTPTPTVKEFSAAVNNVNLKEGVVFDIDRQGLLLYLSFTQR